MILAGKTESYDILQRCQVMRTDKKNYARRTT